MLRWIISVIGACALLLAGCVAHVPHHGHHATTVRPAVAVHAPVGHVYPSHFFWTHAGLLWMTGHVFTPHVEVVVGPPWYGEGHVEGRHHGHAVRRTSHPRIVIIED